VFELTPVTVPDINPTLLNVTPEGKELPACSAYVVANDALSCIDIAVLTTPVKPLPVTQDGVALNVTPLTLMATSPDVLTK
jgi:hypothetical protein